METVELSGLFELLKLLPRPMPWPDFKALALPAFSRPLVCGQYEGRMRWVVDRVESLDLAGEGEPARRIASTADLSPMLVARFVASLPGEWSPITVRDRLMCLRRLCEVAVESRCLIVNPFTFRPVRRIVRVGRPRDQRVLSREEVRRLFELLEGDVRRLAGWRQWRARRLLAAFAIVALTGLRRNELLLLQVADVDLEARVIRLVPRGAMGKGLKTEGSAKPVGMPLALVPILRDWLGHRLDAPAGFRVDPGCPWVIPNCRRTAPWRSGRQSLTPLGRLKAAARRAGIEGVTWRALRRSLATLMEYRGAGTAMIQRQLRHSDPETTARSYLKADEANIAEAMKDVAF